ncbi:MAG: hypothetical protein ABI780_13265, partial [Ardenticatenales bacterium]
ATEARKRRYKLLADVSTTHEPVPIMDKRGNAVLIGEDDWRAGRCGWATNLLAPAPHRQMVFVLPKRLRPYFRWRRKLLGDLARIAARTDPLQCPKCAGATALETPMGRLTRGWEGPRPARLQKGRD